MALVTLASILPPGFGVVLLLVIAQCLQVVSETFPIGALRRKLFTVAFFEKNFPGATPKPAKLGYPDVGYGRYADKLSHEDWLDFCNAQRVHQNVLEQLVTIVSLYVISGLSYPRLTVLMGVVYIVGRVVYGIGYRSGGPSGRGVGSRIYYSAIIVLLISSVVSAVNLTGGVEGLTDFALSLFKW